MRGHASSQRARVSATSTPSLACFRSSVLTSTLEPSTDLYTSLVPSAESEGMEFETLSCVTGCGAVSATPCFKCTRNMLLLLKALTNATSPLAEALGNDSSAEPNVILSGGPVTCQPRSAMCTRARLFSTLISTSPRGVQEL